MGDQNDWISLFVVSSQEISGDLFIFPLNKESQDDVISYRLLQKYPENNAFGEVVLPGVSINDTIYEMNRGLISTFGEACTGGIIEHCVDSYIIWYGSESGIIYDYEYDPICYQIGCLETGGGSGQEAGDCKLDCELAEEQLGKVEGQLSGSNIKSGQESIGIDLQSNDFIRTVTNVEWPFYKFNYGFGFTEQWSAFFTHISRRTTTNSLWRFTSFQHTGTMAVSGGSPFGCMTANMAVTVTPAVIYSNGLYAKVSISGSASVSITCIGSVKTSIQYIPSTTATFVAN